MMSARGVVLRRLRRSDLIGVERVGRPFSERDAPKIVAGLDTFQTSLLGTRGADLGDPLNPVHGVLALIFDFDS